MSNAKKIFQIGFSISAALGMAAVQIVKHWTPIKIFLNDLWEKIKKIAEKFSIFKKIGGLFKTDYWTAPIQEPLMAKKIGQLEQKHPQALTSMNKLGPTVPPTVLAKKIEQLKSRKASSDKINTNINAPMTTNITVAAGATYDQAKNGVQDGLASAQDGWKRTMEQVMNQERRLAYE